MDNIKEKEVVTLERSEMLEIDLLNEKVKCLNLQAEVVKLKSEIYNLKLNKEYSNLSEMSKIAAKKREDNNNRLKDKYSITEETWGYDPITGEISYE